MTKKPKPTHVQTSTINAKTETLLNRVQACSLPAMLVDGQPASTSTWWRLTKSRGVLSVNGDYVKLETIKLLGGTFTSVEAVDRFIAALNGRSEPTRVERTVAIDAAERELSAAGIR